MTSDATKVKNMSQNPLSMSSRHGLTNQLINNSIDWLTSVLYIPFLFLPSFLIPPFSDILLQ